MSNVLEVKVTSRKSEGAEWYEGTISLEGVKATKLARKSDGSTHFTSRSAVQGAARRFAERYGYSDVDFGEVAKPVVKKAAKKSAKSSSSKPSLSKSSSTSSTTDSTTTS